MPKVLLLDLGRVVFGLDWKRPLKKLGLTETFAEKTLIRNIQTWPPYDRLERGASGFSDFVTEVNALVGKRFTDAEFGEAWIEVLTGYEPGVEKVLQKLKGQIPLYALTNTSLIHYEHMMRTYEPLRYFEKVFTSFEIGHRKPEKEIFLSVIEALGVAPEDIYFIDDTEINVEGAKKLGLHATHLKEGETLENVLSHAL